MLHFCSQVKINRILCLLKGRPSRFLLLSLPRQRRTEQPDCQTNGWILDGFPRNKEQAGLMAEAGLAPDAIIVLDRPDDLVREFCLGRCTDSATGVIYHPKYNPPPPEVQHRLTWRLDDSVDVIDRRLAQFHEAHDGLVEVFRDRCDFLEVDAARNDLEIFRDIAEFLDEVVLKMDAACDADARDDPINCRVMQSWGPDVPLPQVDEPQERTLLAAVKRCNQFDMREYVPVYAGTAQIGYCTRAFARQLVPFRRNVDLCLLDVDNDAVVEHGYVNLAPYANTVEERTAVMEGVVYGLVAAGIVPAHKIRDELQVASAFPRGACGMASGVACASCCTFTPPHPQSRTSPATQAALLPPNSPNFSALAADGREHPAFPLVCVLCGGGVSEFLGWWVSKPPPPSPVG